MKNRGLTTRLCAALLAAALVWRILGAPISRQDFENLKTPLRQAKLLLPERAARMFRLWIYADAADAHEALNQKPGEELPAEQSVLVYLTQEKRLAQMPLEDYVYGVTAAEMPAQYHLEALKAQMVAARTRVLWQKSQGGCSEHPGADVCTESTHCQGYASAQQCRERWGASYEAYHQRLVQAQRETCSRWIAYQDQPIVVMYHAISGGRTENVQTVFADQLPYLVSVESAGEEKVRGYQWESFFTFEEMVQRLCAFDQSMQITPDELQRNFSIAEYTESGRVKDVQIGDLVMEATVLRSVLGLRSTWFSITANTQGITFHQRGWGHGVGMSQAGANSMAANGANYEQILKHYYTGVSIMN